MVLQSTPSCPRCGKEMETGFLWTAQPPRWSTEPQGKVGRGENLGKTRLWVSQNFTSWRCQACELVLTDFSASV